jgi:hypothetical protein
LTLLAVDVVGLDIGIIRFIGIIIVVVITALVDLLSDEQANASAGNDGKILSPSRLQVVLRASTTASAALALTAVLGVEQPALSTVRSRDAAYLSVACLPRTHLLVLVASTPPWM